MSDLPAGRELDALVAEKVMGISLIPPREAAMATVGARHVQCTGPIFELDTGVSLAIPGGATLRQPQGTTDWNARYFLYVTEAMGHLWDAEVDAVRNDAKPYSTDIAAAWKVVEKLGEDFNLVFSTAHGGWRARLSHAEGEWHGEAYADTAPLAICRAALKAVGA